MCGEKYKIKKRYPLEMGSPPRMRGKVDKVNNVAALTGITPAYAGKSWGLFGGALRGLDHPRVCGEKQRQRLALFCHTGSPPRMRGKD